MSFEDFLYEYEQLEEETRILKAIFAASIEELFSFSDEDTAYVIEGLYRGLFELSVKMKKLLDNGFCSIQDKNTGVRI